MAVSVRIPIRILALALALALAPPGARAQEHPEQMQLPEQLQIPEDAGGVVLRPVLGRLAAEGFAIMRIRRTWLGRILILSSDGSRMRETVLNRHSGAVLRDRFFPIRETAPRANGQGPEEPGMGGGSGGMGNRSTGGKDRTGGGMGNGGMGGGMGNGGMGGGMGNGG